MTSNPSRAASIATDLATREGCDAVCEAVGDRHVAALLANAGQGLGRAFLEQDFQEVRHVIDTNITGTIVTVTCLMPGVTDTEFFERADLMDTKVGQQNKADPAMWPKSARKR